MEVTVTIRIQCEDPIKTGASANKYLQETLEEYFLQDGEMITSIEVETE